MSKKQWMVLLMLFLSYLLLGASIFYHIESHLEIEHVKKAKQERIEINALLQEHYAPSASHDQNEILGKLTRYCGKSVYNYTEGETDPLKWDFYNSFYFAYTVVSTIGYGNLAPTNMLSRILMIFYGVIGIPMNGILLSQLGEFFGHVFVRAHRKYKSYKRGRGDYYPRKLTPLGTRKVGLAAQIFAYLTPGFVMFIFFPAFLFSHYEGWSYDEAVYYAFVTLTTIGFGDYVAGQDNSKGNGVFFILYKAFLICWISFGLGYIVMIMTFIARGMRSKKITRIEHKLALNLKHTQSKIWNELNKEINYLRRVFNELQLSKVKRVYVDECESEVPAATLPRSSSFPDLRTLAYGTHQQDDIMIALQRPRRRANSEVVPTEDQVARVVSETDLQRIDKTATFAAHAIVQPAELLARLVNILGYIPPAAADDFPETEVIQPDAEASAEEKREDRSKWFDSWRRSNGKDWRIGNERIPTRPRSRAASEIRLYDRKSDARNVDWTWSGPAASRKLRELMKARVNESGDYPTTEEARDGKEGGKSSVFRPFMLAKSVPRNLMPRWRKPFSSRKKSTVSELGLQKPSFEKEDSDRRGLGPLASHLEERRTSNSRRYYYTHTGANPTDFTEGSNLLEETSLADFLRALTVLHASVGTVPDEYTGKPRRKMGTASLTPPKLPSLFTLFSAQPTTANQNEPMANQSGSTTPPVVTAKTGFPFVSKPRRFSLRPVATPISPPTPPGSASPSLSNLGRDAVTRLRNTNSLSESPTLPLIEMERAPGTSSPASEIRRHSLRPAQQPIVSGGPAPPLGGKAVPRWRAGMLQRQIGQMNLRRRSRAFSLSDAYSNEPERNEPAPFDVQSTYARLMRNSPRDPGVSNIRFERDRASFVPGRRFSEYRDGSQPIGSRESTTDGSSGTLRMKDKRRGPLDRYEPLIEIRVEKNGSDRASSESSGTDSRTDSRQQDLERSDRSQS